MNYNVLAQDLIDLHSNLYENHAPEYLAWETRSRLLMDQITTFLPDVSIIISNYALTLNYLIPLKD